MKMKPVFKLGVLVNPFAGIGGALALKGSDGADIRAQALAMGAQQLAPEKMARALADIAASGPDVQVYTAAGDMGEHSCVQAGLSCEVVFTPEAAPNRSPRYAGGGRGTAGEQPRLTGICRGRWHSTKSVRCYWQ